MSKKKSKYDEAQSRLMELLVSNTLKKYGAQPNSIRLSDDEKKELRKTVKKLKKQADKFLSNLHKSVTENDAGPKLSQESPAAGDNTENAAAEHTTENDVGAIKTFKPQS
ncbi:hypothetical protein [Peribacillus sp. SCS-37]|uniref:hypothetical protein n=1 Tax=Paraperibacillus esterisolvens TaxID=3115296 RepID=UPI0039064E05